MNAADERNAVPEPAQSPERSGADVAAAEGRLEAASALQRRLLDLLASLPETWQASTMTIHWHDPRDSLSAALAVIETARQDYRAQLDALRQETPA